MMIIVLRDLFCVVFILWALLDVAGPLLLGKAPFSIIKAAFKNRRRGGSAESVDEATGKTIRSNKKK